MNIELKSNDRVLVTGKTGSGKTFLARFLTRGIRRLIVFDSKGTLNDWNLIDWDESSKRLLKNGEPARVRVRLPSDREPLEYWEEILKFIYETGSMTVYIDELYAIVPPNTQPPAHLIAVYTRGREYRIGVWAATQRPVWIPLVAMSESEHFIVFRLSLDSDRSRLAGFMGKAVLWPIRDQHGFFYSRPEWDNPKYYRKLEVQGEQEKLFDVSNTAYKPIETENSRSRSRSLI